ncbi:MAG TPA: RND transporter, partial [Pseudorhodoferax sp.]|nr:RND transporter [Pseudorhodoferax sp.]
TQARLGLASEYQGLAQRRQQLESEAELALAQDARALAFVALYKALGGAPLPAPDTTAQAQAQAGKAP